MGNSNENNLDYREQYRYDQYTGPVKKDRFGTGIVNKPYTVKDTTTQSYERRVKQHLIDKLPNLRHRFPSLFGLNTKMVENMTGNDVTNLIYMLRQKYKIDPLKDPDLEALYKPIPEEKPYTRADPYGPIPSKEVMLENKRGLM